MRLFNGANRLERMRRRAVAEGELIDVTHKARELGLHDTVCISKRLWTALIHPYPFAQADDCVPLSNLLVRLKAHLCALHNPSTSVFILLPPQLPQWYRGVCCLKVFVNSPDRGCRSIVVQPHSDPFPICRHSLEDTLPATLLVRLAETLRSLIIVARTAEQGLVDSMRTIAMGLIQANPFHIYIEAHVATVLPNTFLSIPPDDHRAVLLADLDELLAIMTRCAGLKSSSKVEALKSHYRAMLSPLASFCQILEDVLRFTATCANGHAPLQGQVFAHFLNLYANVNARLLRLETEVPRDALAVVRFQISLLAQLVATPHVQFLTDIEQACAFLISNRWSHSKHGPARECREAVVWH